MVEGARRLRIGFDAHTVGRRQTGNERYAVELSRALARDPGLDVIAYLDRGAIWPRSPAPADGEREAAQPRLCRLRTTNRWFRIPAELPYRARRDGLDILHVQYVQPPIAATPTATMVADLSFHDRPDLLPLSTRLRLRATTRIAAARSAAILVPSLFTRERFLAVYDVDPARVHVTPEGVSSRWSAASDDDAVGLPVDLPRSFVLAVGASHPRKNLPRVIEAVARARAAGAGDLALVLVGPRSRPSESAARAMAKAAADGWTRHLGFVDDRAMGALYRRATAVAYVSLYEGFGLPVLEAMEAGAAVVGSNTTSIPEVAGEAALLVDPDDAGAIADAIGQIAADTALRNRLIAAGSSRAAQFTWERCAAATATAYRAAVPA